MPESSYRGGIRAAVRATWLGLYIVEDFYESMDGLIHTQIRGAFIEGARQCGISPAEFTQDERTAMRASIQNELTFVWNFGLAIEAGSKANGGKLGPHFVRSEAWILRYRDVKNRARLMACSDQKGEWIQGPTSDGCTTCTSMNGKVKRFSFWRSAGVHPMQPPNSTIQCKGWRCLCEILPTDKPLSRGPLPRFP